MPSFDIVSEVDLQEVDNAVQQARKEVVNRFDLRDAKAEIEQDKNQIKLSAIDRFKLQALQEILWGKLARRQVSLKNIEIQEPDVSPLGHARQVLSIQQGIDGEEGKKISKMIRDLKLKVQAQIQERQVRVTAKNRDDLQKVITFLKGKEFSVALAFTNYRN